MAVTYIVVPHGNPGNPEAPKKFYAQAISSSELTFRPGIDLKDDACNAEIRKVK
jgi:hypothetical protein